MANQQLTVQVGANVAPAIAGINQLNTALKTLPQGTNQAGQALLNLGRVAQDAPFGFIGIANNLNPLLESFQRLGTAAGGLGGALRALGSSLLGAGGIGLALSAFQFIALGGIDVIKRFIGSTQELTDAQQKSADAADDVVKNQSKEIAQVSSLVTALQSGALSRNKQVDAIKELQKIAPDYFGKLDSEKIKISDLAVAYNQYTQSIIGSIEAQIKIGELAEATKKRLDTQRQFKDATAFVNAQLAAGKSLDDINKSLASEKVTKTIEHQIRATDNQVKVTANMTKAMRDEAAESAKSTLAFRENSKDRIDGIGDVVTAMLAEQGILKSIKPTDLKTKTTPDGKDADALKEEIKNIEAHRAVVELNNKEFQHLIDLRIQLARRDQAKNGLNNEQLAKEVNALVHSNEQLEARKKNIDEVAKRAGLLPDKKIEALNVDVKIALNDNATGKLDLTDTQRTIDKLAQDANLRIPLPIALDKDVQAQINAKFESLSTPALLVNVKLPETGVKDLVAKINTTLSTANFQLPSANIDNLKKSLNKAFEETKAGLAQINGAIQNLVSGSISGIGQAIGEAFVTGNLQSALAGFAKTMADGLKQIGEAMIAFGVAKLLFDKGIKSLNPGVAIVAGFGLVIAASALQTALSQRKFAQGGIVTGPTNALIGEAGQPEFVMPLSKMNQFIKKNMVGDRAGGNSGYIAETRLSATDIILMIRRETGKGGGSLIF